MISLIDGIHTRFSIGESAKTNSKFLSSIATFASTSEVFSENLQPLDGWSIDLQIKYNKLHSILNANISERRFTDIAAFCWLLTELPILPPRARLSYLFVENREEQEYTAGAVLSMDTE